YGPNEVCMETEQLGVSVCRRWFGRCEVTQRLAPPPVVPRPPPPPPTCADFCEEERDLCMSEVTQPGGPRLDGACGSCASV
ncbi:MAG TPA: hypothetical protein VFN67_28835, partial [Polyangiales bacterium]|nr:hypothetical protein [Polyangiales bacterium]